MSLRRFAILALAFFVSFDAAFVFACFAAALDQSQPTWKPPQSQENGKLDTARLQRLPDSAFAFPRVRKEPLADAAHVRSAIARFTQVKHVTDAERDLAFANIKKAAQYFGVEVKATEWRQLGLSSPARKRAQQPY